MLFLFIDIRALQWRMRLLGCSQCRDNSVNEPFVNAIVKARNNGTLNIRLRRIRDEGGDGSDGSALLQKQRARKPHVIARARLRMKVARLTRAVSLSLLNHSIVGAELKVAKVIPASRSEQQRIAIYCRKWRKKGNVFSAASSTPRVLLHHEYRMFNRQ